MILGMNATSATVVRGLEGNTETPVKQDGPALIAYVLGQGYTWADNTSAGDALDLLGDGRRFHPQLGPALVRWCEMRARVSGWNHSLTDVGRQQWRHRSKQTWARVFGVPGLPWLGGRAWRDLRTAVMVGEGLTDYEAAATHLTTRKCFAKRRARLPASLRILTLTDNAESWTLEKLFATQTGG